MPYTGSKPQRQRSWEGRHKWATRQARVIWLTWDLYGTQRCLFDSQWWAYTLNRSMKFCIPLETGPWQNASITRRHCIRFGWFLRRLKAETAIFPTLQIVFCPNGISRWVKSTILVRENRCRSDEIHFVKNAFRAFGVSRIEYQQKK